MQSENTPVTTNEEPKKKKGRIANIIVYSIIGLILVIVIFITINMIVSALMGKGYNSIFGMAFMAVETESMTILDEDSGYVKVRENQPEGFNVGDLIFVKEIGNDTTFQEGDIITFYYDYLGEQSIITHRIIQIVGTGKDMKFVTRGDTAYWDTDKDGKPDKFEPTTEQNNEKYDIPLADVIGKYTGVKWGGVGHIGIFMSTPLGYWMVIGVPVFLILVYCIVSFVLTVTKKNKTEVADEKAKLREQILAELRAEQGVPAPAQAVASAPTQADAYSYYANDESNNDASDIDSSIAKIEEEIYEKSGLAETAMPAASDAEEVASGVAEETVTEEVVPAVKPAAKKPASTAKKTTSASKTTSSAKKSTTAAKKTTSTAKKSTTAKSTSSKGLIGTGAKKPAAKKPAVKKAETSDEE